MYSNYIIIVSIRKQNSFSHSNFQQNLNDTVTLQLQCSEETSRLVKIYADTTLGITKIGMMRISHQKKLNHNCL